MIEDYTETDWLGWDAYVHSLQIDDAQRHSFPLREKLSYLFLITSIVIYAAGIVGGIAYLTWRLM